MMASASDSSSLSSLPSQPPEQSRRLRRGRSSDDSGMPVGNKALAFFLLPFGTVFLLFFALPIGYALYQSLFGLVRTSSLGPPDSVFVGLSNYGDVIRDERFLQSLRNMFFFLVGPSAMLVVFGLALALGIDARKPSLQTRFFRLAVFVPFAVPVAIGAIMWGFLYAPSTSPIFEPLRNGLGVDIDPLSAGATLWSVGNIGIWTYVGFNTLIFLTGLMAIDQDIIEAARIDGAGEWRIARSIKLPLLVPSIVLSVVFNIIGTLQLFTEPTILRTVSNSIRSDWSPNMLAYAEAAGNRYSYSATISTVLAIATATLSFSLLRLVGRGGDPQ